MALTKIKLNTGFVSGSLPDANIPDDITISGAQTGITQVGTLTSLTVDDMTLNGSTISDAGAFDIDAGGVIKLDAGGGQIQFFDDGTEIGVFESTSSNFIMESKVQSKDILFKGNDDGSGITALTLDMSEAGWASFNTGITLKNGIFINNADASATSGYLYNDSDNFIIRSYTSNKDIIFKGNDDGSVITAMTIDMSEGGVVGIGIASPGSYHSSTQLAVGNTSGEGQITIVSSSSNDANINFADGTTGTATAEGIIRYKHSNNQMELYTGQAVALTIDSSQRVGIGTTSVNSNAKLHIRGGDSGQTSSSNNTQLTIENSGTAGIQLLTGTSNVGGIWVGDSNGSENGGKLYYSNNDDSWSFYNAGSTNSLNIKSDGSVEINAYSNNKASLNVVASGSGQAPNDAKVYVSKNSSNDWSFKSGAGADDYGFHTNGSGSYALYVTNHSASGAATFRVEYDGDILAENTSIGSISDRRLKKEITNANSQWDDIKALNFVNYKWKKSTGRDDTIKYLGLIADEVESVSPSLIKIDAQSKEDIEAGVEDPEYKTVKYSIVWMKAVKALQEAMEKIETLETKVEELENA